MLTRAFQFVCLFLIAVTAGFVSAQEPDPDMQEMRQQIQQIGMQVMQKMSEQGIDPREFFGDVRQQMRDGSFDMAALQQKLVDQGLIDKETVAKVQSTAQSSTLNSIRRQLDVTDAEWAVIQPKLQRVIIASGDADNTDQMRSAISGLMRGQLAKSDVTIRKQELRQAMANAAVTSAELQAKLTALRDARQKAKEELAVAQKELMELLTGRQEAVLVILGLLY